MEAVLDLTLIPVSLAAAGLDLVSGNWRQPRWFHAVLRFGERCERRIDLWGVAPAGPVIFRHTSGEATCRADARVCALHDAGWRAEPRARGFFVTSAVRTQATLGSLNASISPAKASIGTQLQNTFLSP